MKKIPENSEKRHSNKNAPGKNPAPSDKSDAKEIDRPLNQTRRNFFKCLGVGAAAAIAPGLLEGCYEVDVYDTDFFKNFNPYDYPALGPENIKQWSEKTAYNKDDIPLALKQCLDEEFMIKINPADFYDFDFIDRKATLTPKPLTNEEIIAILSGNGISVKNMTFNQKDGSLYIENNYGQTLTLHQSQSIITMKGSTNAGIPKILTIHRTNNGSGVVCSSSRYIQNTAGKEDFLITKIKVISPEQEIGTYDFDNGIAYQTNVRKRPYSLSSMEGFNRFLNEARNIQMSDALFHQDHTLPGLEKNILAGNKDLVPLQQISTIRELRTIIGKLPKDPLTFTSFIKRSISPDFKDRSKQDEYRNPLETIKSGWADCDDFAMLNYFWAYLQNYKPEFVLLNTGNNNGHVFIYFQDEKEQLVFMDNTNVTILPPGSSIQDYVNKEWPGAKIVYPS